MNKSSYPTKIITLISIAIASLIALSLYTNSLKMQLYSRVYTGETIHREIVKLKVDCMEIVILGCFFLSLYAIRKKNKIGLPLFISSTVLSCLFYFQVNDASLTPLVVTILFGLIILISLHNRLNNNPYPTHFIHAALFGFIWFIFFVRGQGSKFSRSLNYMQGIVIEPFDFIGNDYYEPNMELAFILVLLSSSVLLRQYSPNFIKQRTPLWILIILIGLGIISKFFRTIVGGGDISYIYRLMPQLVLTLISLWLWCTDKELSTHSST